MGRPKKKTPAYSRDFEKMSEEDILSRAVADIEAAEDFREPFITKAGSAYRQFRSYKEALEEGDTRSNLFIPYSFHIIQTQTPKIVNALINTRPFVQTVAMGVPSEEREAKSKKMNMLLDYQFQMRIRFVPFMNDVVTSTLIFGTAITRQGWEYKEKLKRFRVPNAVYGVRTGDYEEISKRIVVKDDPYARLVPLKDFFFDPLAVTIDEARYVGELEYMDYNELVDLQKSQGVEFAHMKEIKESVGKRQSKETTQLSLIGGSTPNRAVQKELEVHTYFTDDWHLIIVNKEFVALSEMNPYYHGKKPYARFVNNPVPGEFYGISEMEVTEDLQEELNTTRNQRIDNTSFLINKMFTILRGANVDPAQLRSRAGGFVEVDDHNDIEELKFSDVTASAYKEEEQVKDDMDLVSGVHDTERGTTTQRRETATTMNILASAGGERFKLKVALIAYGGVHELVQQVIQLDQQYVTEEKEVVILGSDGATTNDVVNIEDIMGQFDIIGVGSAVEPSINKDIQQANITQLYSLLKDNPLIIQDKLLKSIFEVFGFKNVTQYVKPEPLPPPQQEGGIAPDLAMNPALAQGMAQTGNEAGMPMNLGGMM